MVEELRKPVLVRRETFLWKAIETLGLSTYFT
jgi:hypothetical protein